MCLYIRMCCKQYLIGLKNLCDVVLLQVYTYTYICMYKYIYIYIFIYIYV